MDPVVILLIVVIAIITILLVVVGVHVVQVLREVRKLVGKTGQAVEKIDGFMGKLHTPFGQQGGLVEGLKIGLNLAQAFAHWLASTKEITQTRNHQDES